MTGGVWIASYVALWVAVVVLAFAVIVLLRQIGVLHARLHPLGVHAANEGPARDAAAPPLPGVDWSPGTTLVAFTSPTCQICATLMPSLHRLARDYADVTLEIVLHGTDTAAIFRAWQVASTPYVVAVDEHGIVRGGGVANSLEQVEVLLADARGAGQLDVGGARGR